MKNIYDGFTFVTALSLNNPHGIATISRPEETTAVIEDKPFSAAVVEFRTMYESNNPPKEYSIYKGEFGFDWYRKEENALTRNYRAYILEALYMELNLDIKTALRTLLRKMLLVDF